MNPVGRYQIAGEIGRGAMGVVYKALDPAIGRTVAIKTIHLTDLTDADERQRVINRLLREAQSAGTLSHPSIVTVYDVLRQDEFAYIVMEFVPGPSLDVMLREGQIPQRDALLAYLRQVAEALDYAHRKGVIHRDIKPANILISDPAVGIARSAKITDFGIAKIISQEGTQPGNVAGNMSGTPSYMSPEQIEGDAVDGRTDQFSLGVVVYELLCGRKPFAADNVPALLHSICTDVPKSAEQIHPALGASVGKVLSRALAKKPAERFASASDFIGALAIALVETPNSTVEASPSPNIRLIVPAAGPTRRHAPQSAEQQEKPPARTSKKIAVISLLCFAVAAAIVFVVRLSSSAPVPVQVFETHSAPTPKVVSRPLKPKPTAPPAKPVEQPEPSEARVAKARSAPLKTSPLKTPPPVKVPPPVGVIVPAMGSSITDDIDLVSEPAGAKIVVDGRSDATCNAPCTMALATGRHTLTAELNGYAVARRIFVLPGSSSLYIPMAQSTGILVLTSIPSGADIAVDGRPCGQTPATLHLSPGVHRVLLSRGEMQHEETLNIEADSFQTRGVRW